MKGKYHIIIQNNRVHYEFDLRRNITIIRGDSGSGKTTLINMIDLLTNRGTSSGIEISCRKLPHTPRRGLADHSAPSA